MTADIARAGAEAASTCALREVKDLHRRYAHLTVLARWDDLARLFTADATLDDGRTAISGRPDIRAWLERQPGASDDPGAFRVELIDEPIAHLDADGVTARARLSWLCLSSEGDGRTGISGGVLESTYRLTRHGWRIAAQRYHPQFRGDHAAGWTNVDGADLPVVPFHFTPDDAGAPLPVDPAPALPPVRDVAGVVGALEDEDLVRNLVHAYGYYLDRRMWPDAVDLFTDDARVVLAPGGTYEGRAGVRAAMETMGPEGLETGVLNDRPLFDTLVRILPDGRAVTRSIELGMLGDALRHEAAWEVRILTTQCVRRDGVWQLAQAHHERVFRADYFEGWGRVPANVPTDPSEDDPLSAAGWRLAATADHASTQEQLARQLARVQAYDGVENVSSAYGYYIDDFQWPQMAALFAEHGNKHSPFAGFYVGRERITEAATSFWGAPPESRPGISYHWRTQPVISVAPDGRSASFRVRLFQPRTSRNPSREGDFYAAGFHSGMYPNDQAVLENGRWALWSLTVDEPYFTSLDWKGGWASVPLADGGDPPPPSRLMQLYPPDIPMTDLGRRAEHFRGGTGRVRVWPEILPMWFHYRNPVSGREPEHYWPDCAPSEVAPETSMTAYGYLLPSDAPPA